MLLAATTIASFATLGDGKRNKDKPEIKLLTLKSSVKAETKISLRQNYSFRGNQVIATTKEQYINLNTVVTYQQGNITYVMPVKKKVLLNGKLTFNPNTATR